MKDFIKIFFVTLAGLLLINSPVFAAPAWNELDDTQRVALQALEKTWDSLDEQQRDNVLSGLVQWETLEPVRKAELLQIYERYLKLSADHQSELKEKFLSEHRLESTADARNSAHSRKDSNDNGVESNKTAGKSGDQEDSREAGSHESARANSESQAGNNTRSGGGSGGQSRDGGGGRSRR